MSELGVAVIGTGFMGWVHVEALRRVAGVDVVGVLGSSLEKSQMMADRLDIPKAYASLEEALHDRNVQSLHIGTPNRLHVDMARRCLEASKHVMCEKPLAMTSAESRQLVQIARDHGSLAAGVNYNIRFYPLCIEARQRVRTGDLGDIFHVTGSYLQDWLLLPTDYNWRVLSSEGGELRALADIGTHWLDLMHAITGLEVESLCSDLKTVHARRQRPKGEVETFQTKGPSETETEPIDIDTEDYGSVLLRFKGGASGCVHVSQVTAGRKNCLRIEIAGSKQSFAWNSETPNQLWIGHRGRSNEQLMRDPALLCSIAQTTADYPGGHNEGYADSFKQCFRAFYQYIKTGDCDAQPPYPTFADGHREIVLCEAILKSHREQRWIDIEGESNV